MRFSLNEDASMIEHEPSGRALRTDSGRVFSEINRTVLFCQFAVDFKIHHFSNEVRHPSRKAFQTSSLFSHELFKKPLFCHAVVFNI